MNFDAAKQSAHKHQADYREHEHDKAGPRHRFNKQRLILFVFLVILSLGYAGWIFMQDRFDPLVHLPPFRQAVLQNQSDQRILIAREQVLQQPHDPEGWGQLGMVYAALLMNRDAEICWQVAHQLDPRNIAWPYYLGHINASKAPQQAIELFEQAATLAPDNPLAKYRLAELLLETRQADQAEQQLKEIALIERDNPRLALLQARLALLRDDIRSCWLYAAKSVNAAPQSRSSHEMLAQVFNRLNKTEQARQQLEILAQLPPGPTPWPDEFLSEIEALRQDSSIKSARIAQKLQSNEHQQGLVQLKQYVKDYPDDAIMQIMLIRTLQQAGRHNEAFQTIEAALTRHPDSAEIHRLKGLADLHENNWDSAIAEFQQSIELKPDNIPAIYELAQTFIKLNRVHKARKALEDITRIQPNQVSAHRLLCKLFIDDGNLVAAREHLDIALRFAPEDQEILNLEKRCVLAENKK